jgi:uncharacterized protein (TIGR02757 family)
MPKSNLETVKILLEKKYIQFNRIDFIENDPISIPHLFSKKQDIEIMGFWAAILSWGQRKTIINKCNQLVNMMDNAPYDFILNHQEADLKPFLQFKHRTFNDIDTLYFIAFFKHFYSSNISLEEAFKFDYSHDQTVENGIVNFHNLFFSLDYAPSRTRKHVSTPTNGSACKRINMFLRWMVRNDTLGVDFGIWDKIKPYQLVCPCDVHVDRVARSLGLITRKQTDWKTAIELTQNLKLMDWDDPVKYDFALFGMGEINEF